MMSHYDTLKGEVMRHQDVWVEEQQQGRSQEEERGQYVLLQVVGLDLRRDGACDWWHCGRDGDVGRNLAQRGQMV